MRPCVVISQPWGGLGDNLQYTTLPPLFVEKGFDVYISSANTYRNPEIFDLVWKLNPFIKGVINAPGNAGGCRGLQNKVNHFMRNTELAHGLDNGKEDYPLIYYTPKFITDLSSCILFDSTSISASFTDVFLKKNFQSIIEKHRDLTPKKIVFNKIANHAVDLDCETYTINSIFDMCDAIYSCKVFATVMSGAAVLASAIKKDRDAPHLYVFHKHQHLIDSHHYRFKNAEYIFSNL